MASQQSTVLAVRPKWHLDDIILPEKRGECEDCVCSVCHGIWNDPVQTVNCQHIFCKSCVLDLPNPMTICPICRENVPLGGFVDLQIANKPVLRRLNNLPVLCPYHKPKPAAEPLTAAAVSGRAADGQDSEPPLTRRRVESRSDPGLGSEQCAWRGSFADLNKHLASCEWCPVTCPHGCGEEMRRPQLEEHLPGCLLNFKECDICHDKVRPAMMAEHERSEAQRHVKILLEERKDLKKIGGVEQNLRVFFARQLEAAKADLAEQLEATKVDLGKKLKAANMLARITHVKDAVWIVKDIAAVRQQHQRGSSFMSPPFQLGPVANVRVAFCPNGDHDCVEGRYALFVYVNDQSAWLLKLVVKLGAESCQMTHGFTLGGDDNYGWPNFGKVSDLPEAGEIEIKIRLLGATLLVSE